MAQLSRHLRGVEGGGLLFWCQGCRESHLVRVGDGPGPRWHWNGDVERPVFTPSVLVRGVQFLSDEQTVPLVCHSYVGCNGARPGEIVYLSDCTHELAGQVVPLAELPLHMRTAV